MKKYQKKQSKYSQTIRDIILWIQGENVELEKTGLKKQHIKALEKAIIALDKKALK